MPTGTGGGRKFATHPLVEKLTATGYKGKTVKLAGYFGHTTPEGIVQIHPTLEDLNEHIEVREEDIVHTEPAPESELPHGGSYIWVKATAEIRHTRTQSAEESGYLEGGIAREYMPAGTEEYGPVEVAYTRPASACRLSKDICKVTPRVSCLQSCRIISCANSCNKSCMICTRIHELC